MRRPTRLRLAFLPALCFFLPSTAARSESVNAAVETTLATGAKQIRQFAFDGDAETFFDSKEKLRASDHFTLVFERPVAVKSLAVITGKPGAEATGALAAGVLEVSADGSTFTEVAKFADGKAQGDLQAKPVRAVRIKPTADQEHPLAVREFSVVSDPPVTVFKYPVEIVVDCSDSPEMKDWAEKAARVCEAWYTRLNEALKSDGYKPSNHINMRISSGYNGVAEASGSNILGSTKFFKAHPDDIGAMIHETVHVIQHYRGRRNPSWLVEGVADYIRFFLYEPGKIGPSHAERSRYNGSYRTTAAFLAYVSDKYDKDLVFKLNKLMREGNYKVEVFEELTGKTVQALDEEWRASLKR